MSYDHTCTKNERHGVCYPDRFRVGAPCPVPRCTGTLAAVGAGSIKANKEAQHAEASR